MFALHQCQLTETHSNVVDINPLQHTRDLEAQLYLNLASNSAMLKVHKIRLDMFVFKVPSIASEVSVPIGNSNGDSTR